MRLNRTARGIGIAFGIGAILGAGLAAACTGKGDQLWYYNNTIINVSAEPLRSTGQRAQHHINHQANNGEKQ